ncbi:hypothetical protein Cwoe_1131 [Conexibacter woesei DSM 14684]|uniref:Uncharacterized protein n=1 Tax=Conexibacter woesei (strain DSM 14684 / CCUG 47730 / CIP 108061 / JCM 11494 / NBRC 100937 / ID131577) TaxID=469383 RepID=D3FDI8_CONWI|nr:hypothetical protein Cwoe_1131 [Conexibacter woesei DSM 14684]
MLGSTTPLHLGLRVDLRSRPSPVARIAMRYPRSLGVTTSGLGLAACHRTLAEFTEVVIDGLGLAGCPRNSVMARGRALGEVRLGGEPVFREEGTVTVLAGPIHEGRMGLVGMVDGLHPVGAKLVYEGQVLPAAWPYGGALTIGVRQLPARYEAEIALDAITFSVGSDDILYHERVGGRTVAYRPGGLLLPDRCPRGGFPFDAAVTFLDGGHERAAVRVPCPRRRGRSPAAADG